MTRYSQGRYGILVEDVRFCIRRRHGISLGTIPAVTLNQGTGAGVSGSAGCKSREWEDQLGTVFGEVVGQAVGLRVGDTVGVSGGLSLGELVGEAEVRVVKLGWSFVRHQRD